MLLQIPPTKNICASKHTAIAARAPGAAAPDPGGYGIGLGRLVDVVDPVAVVGYLELMDEGLVVVSRQPVWVFACYSHWGLGGKLQESDYLERSHEWRTHLLNLSHNYC